MELRLVFGPDGLQGLDALGECFVPGRVGHVGAVIRQFLGEPSDGHTKAQSPTAENVKGRDTGREVEQVVFEHHGHTSAEEQVGRVGGSCRERHDGSMMCVYASGMSRPKAAVGSRSTGM